MKTQKTPLFQGIGETALAEMFTCGGARCKTYAKGEVLLRAGCITREMPTLEPSRGGLTTTGSGRCVVVASGASTSYSAVGTPCASRHRLVAILSMARRLATAPAPV